MTPSIPAWRPPAVPIAGELRSRINRIAHAAGIRHELAVKAQLVAELQKMAGAGHRMHSLSQHLDTIEAGTVGGGT